MNNFELLPIDNLMSKSYTYKIAVAAVQYHELNVIICFCFPTEMRLTLIVLVLQQQLPSKKYLAKIYLGGVNEIFLDNCGSDERQF